MGGDFSGVGDGDLAVVIVTFGAHDLLDENIGTMQLPRSTDRVVIVDNFHSDHERAAIRDMAAAQGWIFLPNDRNLGFGAAVNVGVAWAFSNGFEFALVLNPDARIDTDSIAQLRAECERDPLTLVGPRIVRTDGSVWFRAGQVDLSNGDVSGSGDPADLAKNGWISGACFMVHRNLWNVVGGFDVDFFLYWEDIDLSWRWVAAGGRIKVRQDLVAVHDAGGTQPGTGKSATYFYYNCRNRLLFAAKHLSGRQALRWVVRTPAASKRILYRGGRRQLVTSMQPLSATVRGSIVGALAVLVAVMGGSWLDRGTNGKGRRSGSAADRTDIAAVRIYASLRSAHLERFRDMMPARILYNRTRYDFDESLISAGNRPVRKSRWGVVRELLTTRYDVVEINEPLMSTRWLDLVAQVGAVRLRGGFGRNRTRIVSYAIGYTDPADDIAIRRSVPRGLAFLLTKAIAAVLVANTDRLAFGTTGSSRLYDRYVPTRSLARRSRLFEALPSPCECVSAVPDPARSTSFVFVGAFDDRKGIRQLLRMWECLSVKRPSFTLHLMGKGKLLDEVTEWAAGRPEVVIEVDPPRARIHEVLRVSGTLVLLSQRVGAWREQVGLPIVEGLAHGCEIITTTETGLADWLRTHGHMALDPQLGAEEMASMVADRSEVRDRQQILGSLPVADQRIAADRWLMSERSVPDLQMLEVSSQ